ncbi:MAG: hypothetical protein WBK19_10950 [Azonexus sp.]
MKNHGYSNNPVIAPAILSRLAIFSSSLHNIQESEVEIENTWGKVKVSGRLGGVHRRILDSSFAVAEDRKEMQTGQVALLIDPYKLSKVSKVKLSSTWLDKIFRDMRVATVTGHGRNGERFEGGIISEWKEAKKKAKLPGGMLQGERSFRVLIVSAAWMRIYDTSLVMRYKSLLPTLHEISNGAAYSLALLVITHREFNQPLEKALRDIRALRDGMSDRACRKVKKTVRDELAKHFDRLRIAINENDTVVYRQIDEVRFSNFAEPLSVVAEPLSVVVEPLLAVTAPLSVDLQESSRGSQERRAAA